MKEVIGVRFRENGKIYFFNPLNYKIDPGRYVIVETQHGVEFGKVVLGRREVDETKLQGELKPIIRIATEADEKKHAENLEKNKKAMVICKEKIEKRGLEMKLIDAEYTFDNNKVLFYFTADGRIDFRELVKDLAAIFKTRIELRQIGVRDEVRRMGGNGVCGRELCCCSFLNNFDAVSIKMAKEQNMSLNPSKISGVCGRLMCCLKYEQEAYEEKLRRLPKVGSIVETVDGEGTVDSVEILKENVRVKFEDDDGYHYKRYKAEDVKLIKASETEEIDPEEKENEKELEELENLAKNDILVEDDM